MIWTAWKSGKGFSANQSFGFKVSVADRDEYFHRSNDKAFIELPVKEGFRTIECTTDKDSFWNSTCRELINREVGAWFLQNQFIPWANRKPVKFQVKWLGENRFRVLSTINE